MLKEPEPFLATNHKAADKFDHFDPADSAKMSPVVPTISETTPVLILAKACCAQSHIVYRSHTIGVGRGKAPIAMLNISSGQVNPSKSGTLANP